MTLSQNSYRMVPIICIEELLVQQTKAVSRPTKRTHEPSSSSTTLLQDLADLYDSSRTATLDPVVYTHIIDQTYKVTARACAGGTPSQLPGPLDARPDYNTTGDDTICDNNTTTTQAVQIEIGNGTVRCYLNANDFPTDYENDMPHDLGAAISRHD